MKFAFVITFLVIVGSVYAEWEDLKSFSSRDLFQLPDGVELPEGDVRFCGATGSASLASGETQCDFIKYGTSLAAASAPGIVMGVLSFFAWIVFSIITCCTWCKNCQCCGGKKAPAWIITYIVYAVGTAAIIVGFIIALVGDKGVSSNATDTQNIIIGVFDQLINGVDKIQVALNDPAFTEFVPANQTAGISTSLGDAKNSIAVFRDTTVEVRTTVDEYLYYREVAVIVSVVIPLGIAAIAILLRFCKLPSLFLVLASVSFFWMMILWLSFTIHLVVDRVVTDVCVEVDLVLADPTLNAPGNASLSSGGIGGLSALVACAKNESQFDPLLDLTQGTFDGAIQGACDAIQTACSVNGSNCDPVAFSNPCNLQTIDAFSKTNFTDPAFFCNVTGQPTFVEDPFQCDDPLTATFFSQSIRITDCPTLCRNPTLQTNSDTLLRGLQAATAFETLLNDVVFPLLSCSFVADTFAAVQNELCNEFTDNVRKIWAGTVIVCIGSIISCVAFFMANRRKLDVDDDHKDYEMN